MDVDAIRFEMLKCYKNCRVGIMPGSRDVSLMWRIGSHWHQVFIKKEQCTINSKEFLEALESAKIGLIY